MITMTRRLVGAAAAASLALMTLGVGTASATVNFAGGLYDNNDGNDGNLSNNYFIVVPAVSANNAIDSIKNLGVGGKSMKLYDGYNGSSFIACIPHNMQAANLLAASNKTSSHYKGAGAGC